MKISVHKKLIAKVKAFNQKADRKSGMAIIKILKGVTSRSHPYFYHLFSRMQKHLDKEEWEKFREDLDDFWAYYGKLYGKTKEEIQKTYNKIMRKKEKK